MRVLLVEDESLVADLVVRGLSSEGWDVVEAASAEAALALLQEQTFDVMVLDRTLGGMSGIELCQQLRDDANYIPILMLTAMGAVSDRVEGLGAGADDYLTKPFAFDELIARVGALGRRSLSYSQAEQLEDIQLGDLKFNVESLQLFLNNTPLDLTAKERELLVYFMKNPNKAISRETILDQVWGEDADPFSNIVDVYIGKLRRKLGTAEVQIDTVRGAGYRCTYLSET